jgi:hypothetical protein
MEEVSSSGVMVRNITNRAILHANVLEGVPNDDLPTPKSASVGGVQFVRSKRGNMYRLGYIRARRWGSWQQVVVAAGVISSPGVKHSC